MFVGGLFFYSIIKLQQIAEMRYFGACQRPVGARFQRSQIEEADSDALKLFHQPAEVLKHDADLVLPAFHQLHLVPGIDAFADQF